MSGDGLPWSSDDPLRGWVDDDLADRLAGQERVDIDLTAAELAEAEWARAGWRDRLVGGTGGAMAVHLSRTTVHGRLVELFADALLLGDDRTAAGAAAAEGDLVVAWHAVRWVETDQSVRGPGGPQPGRVRPARALLRRWSADAEAVTVVLVDGRVLAGRLATVTADTVDLLDDTDGAPGGRRRTAPWHAVATVRRSSG